MSFKVVILESAEYDLKELRSYIVKNFSLETWQNTYGKLKKAIRNLKTFPLAGSVPEEIEMLNTSQNRQVGTLLCPRGAIIWNPSPVRNIRADRVGTKACPTRLNQDRNHETQGLHRNFRHQLFDCPPEQ